MEKINTKKWLIISIFALLIINITSVFSHRNEVQAYTELVNDLTEVIDKMPITMFDAVLNEQLLCYQYESTAIDSTMTIRNDDGIQATIGDIFDDQYKLVIRYSKFGCKQCIDSVVTIANRIIGNQSIVHFTLANNLQEMKIYKKLNHIDNKIYDVAKLDLSVEDLNMPYLFVMNQQCQLKSLFIPHKEIPGQIEKYLETVKQIYSFN